MKTCVNCLEDKGVGEYYGYIKAGDIKTTYHAFCKVCDRERNDKIKKSLNGRLTSIYSDQRKSCIKRKMNPPTYTRHEFDQFMYNSTPYRKLHDEWKEQNYPKRLSPSVNRLDDYKTYSLDNIEVITWEEHQRKTQSDRTIRKGKNKKIWRAVVQLDIEDNLIDVYENIKQTSDFGFNISAVGNCCRGVVNKHKGFKWSYLSDYMTKKYVIREKGSQK